MFAKIIKYIKELFIGVSSKKNPEVLINNNDDNLNYSTSEKNNNTQTQPAYKIIISAGHATFAKGAYNPKFKISEYDITSNLIVHMMCDYNKFNYQEFTYLDLSSQYENLYYTSYSSYLNAKYKCNNSYKPDLILEFHLNAAENIKAKGSELVRSYDKYTEKYCKFMAGAFDEYNSRLGENENILKCRRVVTPKDLGRDLFILDEAKYPTVIIELGFISHDLTAKKFIDDEFIKLLAVELNTSTSIYFRNNPKAEEIT